MWKMRGRRSRPALLVELRSVRGLAGASQAPPAEPAQARRRTAASAGAPRRYLYSIRRRPRARAAAGVDASLEPQMAGDVEIDVDAVSRGASWSSRRR